MSRCLNLLVVCLLLNTTCGVDLGKHRKFMGLPTVTVPSQSEIDNHKVVAGSYIVAFRNNLPFGGLYHSTYLSEYNAHYNGVLNLIGHNSAIIDVDYITALDMTRAGSSKWQPIIRTPFEHKLFFGVTKDDVQGASITRVDFRSDEEAQKTLESWYADSKIWYAEPNRVSHLNDDGNGDFATLNTTYSGYTAQSPWYQQIDLPGAFTQLASEAIDNTHVPIIAVMDSGVDYQHPALVQNIWQNPAVNQTGCQNDLYGCNTTKGRKGVLGNGDVWPAFLSGPQTSCAGVSSVCMHGTHVSGIIAAAPQTSKSYGGVCPLCKIMIVKIVGKTSRGDGQDDSIIDSSIIGGFAYISKFVKDSQTAVRLINASFGKSQISLTVELLIRSLKSRGSGTLVVAAAGNEDTMLRQYPAAYEDVLSVANVDSQSGIKHPSSNYGPWVDIAAPGAGTCNGPGPGGGILSSVPGLDKESNGNVECEIGTSMSTPIVAGIAGLLLLQNPGLSMSQLTSVLVNSSDSSLYNVIANQPYLQLVEGNMVPLLGIGIVNAGNAVKRVMPPKMQGSISNRVTDSCATLANRQDTRCAWIIILMPLLGIFGQNYWRRRHN